MPSGGLVIKTVYMPKLDRTDTSMIFKSRRGMIDVKNNFRNKYTNDTCRKCNQTQETQEHILESCPKIHPGQTLIVITRDDLLENNPEILTNAARKIGKILKLLSET